MSANFNCQIVSTEQSEAVITGEDAVTTILEQLESAGIQVESQCRSGYCGACRLKKKSGEVKYDNDRWLMLDRMKFWLAVVDLVASWYCIFNFNTDSIRVRLTYGK